MKDKIVVIYNRDFDMARLNADCKRYDLPALQVDSFCAMDNYSRYVGEWNDYYKNYKWQRLPSGDHSALGDARATLWVIEEMASVEPNV